MIKLNSIKKFFSLFMTAVLLFSFGACSKYKSSYKAIGLVRMNTSHSCEASFYSLEGRLVFKLKKTDVGSEGDIYCSVQVDEGEIRLYYDIYGVKQELAHVKAGETLTERRGYVEGGYTVYIIIEAVKGTRGKIVVDLDGAGA
ncbi:MAG: hypothetical protein IKD15_00820 [Clostridia bacterium]|nr:hypothetical protein [Clostridia bacterium]